jgi:hypothetical protein
MDTCSWLKVRGLEEANVINLKFLFYESDLWATHELAEELKYHLQDFLDLGHFSIQTVKLIQLETFTEKELDPADLSIIEFGRKHPGVVVISDDGAELEVLHLFKTRCFRLSEYLLFLVEKGILRKRDATRAITQLRAWQNIPEKTKKKLLAKLNMMT